MAKKKKKTQQITHAHGTRILTQRTKLTRRAHIVIYFKLMKCGTVVVRFARFRGPSDRVRRQARTVVSVRACVCVCLCVVKPIAN
jgi:hypothetical protein